MLRGKSKVFQAGIKSQHLLHQNLDFPKVMPCSGTSSIKFKNSSFEKEEVKSLVFSVQICQAWDKTDQNPTLPQRGIFQEICPQILIGSYIS